MRRITFPVLMTLTLGLLATPAAAQEKYPSRPIDFVVTLERLVKEFGLRQ